MLSIFITDINECLDNDGTCSHICNNTEGSYHCECPTGYLLQLDNHNCEGENEQFNWLCILFNYTLVYQ